MTATVAALCAGYGGLEMGLSLAGIDHELAWFAELDRHAAAVMAAHATAPNLGDICAITDPPPVDIITAGFPCQPFSSAGQRRGVNDERWLIDDVCRVARTAGARWLILENVAGLLTANDGHAMARVCAAMAETGFSRWEWTTLRASDVGACHQRERWFCVARSADTVSDPDGNRRQAHTADTAGRRDPAAGRAAAPDPDGGQPERRRGPSQLGGSTPAEQGQGDQRQRAGHAAGDSRAAAPDPNGTRLARTERPSSERVHGRPAERAATAFGPYAPAVERWAGIVGRPAPHPTTDDGRLSPVFVEWMMGLPAGWVTDLGLSRTQSLRVLGNGVVPQQAAAAIRHLAAL